VLELHTFHPLLCISSFWSLSQQWAIEWVTLCCVYLVVSFTVCCIRVRSETFWNIASAMNKHTFWYILETLLTSL
jgi:hypothetical protein